MNPTDPNVQTVLIVEDDPEIADLIRLYLEREAFLFAWAPDIACAERLWRSETPSLILLDTSERVTIGNLVFDYLSREVFFKGKAVAITSKERQLLFYLVKHRGRVLSVQQLYQQVWGFDAESDERTVFVHVRNLRKKVEEDPNAPHLIVTMRGFGYRFTGN